MSDLTGREIRRRAFMSASSVLYDNWFCGVHTYSRMLDDMIIPRNYIEYGVSLSQLASVEGGETGKIRGYAEHIVPLTFLNTLCYKYFDQKKASAVSREEVVSGCADILERYLKIVYVTETERYTINGVAWDRMPAGWIGENDDLDQGDPLRRLHDAGVRIRKFDKKCVHNGADKRLHRPLDSAQLQETFVAGGRRVCLSCQGTQLHPSD